MSSESKIHYMAKSIVAILLVLGWFGLGHLVPFESNLNATAYNDISRTLEKDMILQAQLYNNYIT